MQGREMWSNRPRLCELPYITPLPHASRGRLVCVYGRHLSQFALFVPLAYCGPNPATDRRENKPTQQERVVDRVGLTDCQSNHTGDKTHCTESNQTCVQGEHEAARLPEAG